jgi:hypothetical protein
MTEKVLPNFSKPNYTESKVDQERSQLILGDEDDDDSGLAMAEDLNRLPTDSNYRMSA